MGTLLAAQTLLGTSAIGQRSQPKPQRFRIGACDWSLGKTANAAAFDAARQIGLDGVQVSYNAATDEAYLSKPENLNAIQEASARTGVRVSSLAIGLLNSVPYKSEPRTDEWVSKAIDAAYTLKAPTILLAFFSKNDLRNDSAGKKEVIRKLREVAPKAEKRGVTLGIESYLTAAEHLDILQAVGSKAVKVYYDFRNATDAGNDIFKEFPMLGTARICEIHMKENGRRLGKGTIDWPRVSRMLHESGYHGWMQIEGATAPGDTIPDAYRQNLTYLRHFFTT